MWLAVRGCISDWCNSVRLITVCSQHMVLNELSHSGPSLRLSQDFPPVLHSLSGRMAVQQPRWPNLVAWWHFLFFPHHSSDILLYLNVICDPAKSRVQDLFYCLSMQCFLVLIKGHAFLYTHTSAGGEKNTPQIKKKKKYRLPHYFLSLCVFARIQMLLLLLGKESPEHLAFLWVIPRCSCPEFSMHILYLVIYSPKNITLWDKKLETHFLLSLICSHVLAVLITGFSEALKRRAFAKKQSRCWQKLLWYISPVKSLHTGKCLWLISATHWPGHSRVKKWALQNARSLRDVC